VLKQRINIFVLPVFARTAGTSSLPQSDGEVSDGEHSPTSTNGESTSAAAPKKKTSRSGVTSRGKSVTPRKKPVTPRKEPVTPRKKLVTPRKKPVSPWKNPDLQNPSLFAFFLFFSFVFFIFWFLNVLPA